MPKAPRRNTAAAARFDPLAMPANTSSGTPRYGAGRSRVHKPPFETAFAALRSHFSLRYTPHPAHPLAGGCDSFAICGPNAFSSFGTDADSSKPGAIAAAREKYPEAYFKAGHLLNADFGGDGQDPQNLTILTAQGNTLHKNFDNPLKDAGAHLKSAYRHLWEDGIDISKLNIGISIRVRVSGNPWGSEFPDACIFDELTCEASLFVGSIPLSAISFEEASNKVLFDVSIGLVKNRIDLANDYSACRKVPNA